MSRFKDLDTRDVSALGSIPRQTMPETPAQIREKATVTKIGNTITILIQANTTAQDARDALIAFERGSSSGHVSKTCIDCRKYFYSDGSDLCDSCDRPCLSFKCANKATGLFIDQDQNRFPACNKHRNDSRRRD